MQETRDICGPNLSFGFGEQNAGKLAASTIGVLVQ
jgi:hypothetical protein